jgi:thioredoxin 2
MMAPHYQAAAEKLNGDVRFFKLDSDQNRDAAARLQIRAIPTLLGWRGGRMIANQPGAQTGAALETWIRQSFSLS